ncbi:MAG: carboxypeptidase regulatory-like domain-containing protein [Candidatus Riflebacteria bacterium]|nr:carboxypeptidase regulatory-like domain-containing protein [Candidatus Riflebacteria bacterium]
MKKIRYIVTLLLFIVLLAHAGCMSTESAGRGGVAGIVTDSYGAPLSGVRIAAPDASTMSDVYGKWVLESLPAQTTELTVSRENYQTQKRSVEVTSGETLEKVTFALASDGDIFDVQVTSVTSTSAQVIFYTRQKASGYVKYGRSGLLEEITFSDTEAIFTHQYVLTGLIPASTYRLKCVAIDQAGRTIESELITFNTPYTLRSESPTALTPSKVANSNIIKLDWSSDVSADFAGFKIYRSESAQGPFALAGSVNQNSYSDNNVVPGIKYYYRVTRVSGTGEESSPSAVESFLMPGVMTQNVVWKAQNSPYQLTGDLTVVPGVSLVIDKGVTINVSQGNQWDSDSANDLIELRVQGTLMIQGTADMPVVMTSASGAPTSGDWQGIVFDVASDLGAGLIKGLRLSFAEYGLDGLSGLPQITESNFTSCRVAGVRCSSARSNLLIQKLYIDSCASGMLIRDNNVNVTISDNRVIRCVYGIVSRDNKYAEIERNQIGFSGVSGLDVGNNSISSIVRYNIVGWGSTGTGLICRGRDEIRRNTLHANVGIEIRDTAQAVIRSNLMLVDNSRNGIGVLYTGVVAYNPTTATNTLTIQNNAVWNVTTNARKYANSNGAVLGASADLALTQSTGPALQGGDPFVEFPNLNYSYIPSSGSPLKGMGYDYESVGAENVPD